MLNELSDHVDSTEVRLATARRKLEDFLRKSEGTSSSLFDSDLSTLLT
jgi:hypothetical protein